MRDYTIPPPPPRWIQELDGVMWLCHKARTQITHEDPNVVWKHNHRGDWMLFYIWLLLIVKYEDPVGVSTPMRSLAISRASRDTNEIAEAVNCPKVGTPFAGLEMYAWSTIVPVDEKKLYLLAQRIRELWPNIPLAI